MASLNGQLFIWHANDKGEAGGLMAYATLSQTPWTENFIIATKILAAAIFLLQSSVAAVSRKRVGLQPRTLTLIVFAFLACQCLLIASSSWTFQQGLQNSAQPTRPELFMVLAHFLVAVVGSVVSIIHVVLQFPQTPRMMFTLAMLLLDIPAALSRGKWPEATIAAVIYASMFWLDLMILPPVRLYETSALQEASFFHRICFVWLSPIVSVRKTLDLTSGYSLSAPSDILPESTYQELKNGFRDNTIRLSPLSEVLQRLCVKEMVLSFLFEMSDIVCKFIQPWILRSFLLSQSPSALAGMFLVNIVNTIVKTQASYNVKIAGMKLRSALIRTLFEKTLHLSPASSFGSTPVTNLAEVDTQRVQDAIVYIHAIWSAPLQVIVCLANIWLILGWSSSLAGVTCIVLMLPLFSIASVKIKYWQGLAVLARDARMYMTAEILYRIKTVKLLGQQALWCQKLDEARDHELDMQEPIAWLTATNNVMMRLAPTLISIAAFSVVLAGHGSLDNQAIFPTLLIFGLLIQPLSLVSVIASLWTGCMISYRNLQAFCLLEELHDATRLQDRTQGSLTTLAPPNSGNMEITINEADFCWPGAASHVLSLNSHCFRGPKLITISGSNGSGKSTLLSLLTGAIVPSAGEIVVRGSIAYMGQSPWLMSATIRENILMGEPFHAARYSTTVKACALESDFLSLPEGDCTPIGSVGVALSGGQKARVALARAVYSRARILLLDDPLAAVDNTTREHLMNEVIGPDGLLKDRLRIITTNSLHLTDIVDERYSLDGGALRRDWSSEQTISSRNRTTKPSEAVIDDGIKITHQGESKSPVVASVVALSDEQASEPRVLKSEASSSRSKDESKDRISFATFWRWCSTPGSWQWLAVAVGISLANAANVASIYVLKLIAISSVADAPFYMVLYFGLGILQGALICTWLMASWYWCQRKTSFEVHSRLVKGTLGSPLHIFDTTPIGTILNRFTNDLSRMDVVLMAAWLGSLNLVVRLLTAVFVLILYSPLSLLYIIPPLYLCWRLQQQYIRVCLPLKRMETSSRSPILSNLQEIQAGSATIRVFGVNEIFRRTNLLALQQNIEAGFTLICLELWLMIRLDLYSAVIQVAAGAALAYQGVDAGTLGLVMSYLLQISGYLSGTVLLQTQMESEMVCVQRIYEMCDNQPEGQEPGLAAPVQVPAIWPTQGHVSFKKYSASYKPGAPFSLSGISLDIRAREKIAIVGRTGAGKSSMALALLRVFEAAEGGIEIDGLDISRVRLEDLRSRVTIIPQDSQVFTNTVRRNIDPEDRYDTQDLLRVLQASCFDREFDSTEEALNLMLVDGGSNISNGQRQLLALARALLADTKVVIWDEATAATDDETESLVQKSIAEYCQDKTTITIAHRLQTVMNSDRVVVLDAGHIVEIGPPAQLLLVNGHFSDLVKKQGLNVAVT